MANITLGNRSYSNVPALNIPKTGGGSVRFADVSPTTATASDVTSGKVFFKSDGTQDVGSATPSTPTTQSKSRSYTPTESAQSETVTPDTGYDGLSSVDVSVGAIDSNYVGSNVPRRDSTDLAASGATVSVPAGYYANNETKSVGNGSVGIPTATKGAVSNHQMTITPSTTASAGYVPTGYVGGFPITVAASELVSGDLPITSNGSNIDVTDYETVSVNVQGGGGANVGTATVSGLTGYPRAISFTGLQGQPIAFFVKLTSNVSSSGNTTYYYIVDISYDGTNVHGNCFRIGSSRRVDNVTSGYSFTYNNGTLSVSSSAYSRSQSPGAFYNGSYELVYVY